MEHIETETGVFQYRWDWCPELNHKWLKLEDAVGWSPAYHPSPLLDGLLCSANQLFACPSIETFEEWFPPLWRKMLAEFDVKPVMLVMQPGASVEISNSKLQCLFQYSEVAHKIVLEEGLP